MPARGGAETVAASAPGARVQTTAQAEALAEAAWAFVYWRDAVAAAAAGFGLPAPSVRTRYTTEATVPGSLNLYGTAAPGAVTIRLEGSGWRTRSDSAERLLLRNAAHEAAHLYQHAKGRPTEAQWLHEGFADALAQERLAAAGGTADPAGGQRCAAALRRAPLRSRFAAGDPDAIYDCGSVLIRAVATARGETVRTLYDALVAAGRDEAAFLRLAGEASEDWERSARAFLGRDYTQSDPFWVMRTLRAGQL